MILYRVRRQWQEVMRGSDARTGSLFSYVDIETRIARDHPLRLMRELVNEALARLDPAFARLYAREGSALDRTGAAAAGRACCSCSIRSARSGS